MADILFFENRSKEFDEQARHLQTRFVTYSWARIITFLIGISVSLYFANAREGGYTAWTLLITAIIFLFVVFRHTKIRYLRDHFKFLSQINKDEESRLKGDLGEFDQGIEFVNQEHAYTSDLDILGAHSVFQLVNRTCTSQGRSMLASWLLCRASKDEIPKRQEAVKEISSEIDWRQEFQASAMHHREDNSDISGLYKWLETPEKVQGRLIYIVLAYVGALLALTTLTGFFMVQISFYWFIGALVVNGIILSQNIELAKTTGNYAARSIREVQAFQKLMKMTETRNFKSAFLNDLQQRLVREDGTASSQIRRLNFILQWFDARSNAIYHIVNLILLLDVHILILAERWKFRNRDQVRIWIDAIARIEAISSLAGLDFGHDDYSIPIISDTLELELKNVGHPLIKSSHIVCNDFALSGQGKVVVITGSNMSGKSTFLRTIGVNLVLGLAGGPIRAEKAVLPYIQLFSGMRSVDNLEEHISSFYAELKRIRQLLDLLKDEHEPVFYLLDEVLKGTNSRDRHAGSKALISQLSQKNCMGLVSTHDLELGDLETQFGKVANFSFTSDIKGDEILFDYRIRPGICKSFNASKLMDKMGIIKYE